MQVIGFNGPPRSGKTYTAEKIMAALPEGYAVKRFGYVDILYEPAMRLHNFKPYAHHEWVGSAENFKDFIFQTQEGLSWTGREIIIEMSEMMQKRDPLYLIRAMEKRLDQARFDGYQLAIVENVGKIMEWDYLSQLPSRLQASTLPKPMLFGLKERRAAHKGKVYLHGDVFFDDNRVALTHDYKMLNPSVSEILDLCGIEV